jgi:hypothetical protein
VRGTGVYGGIFWTLQSSIAELREVIDAKKNVFSPVFGRTEDYSGF